MNILFINEIGGFWGGVEQNIALAAAGLHERGHSCHFAASSMTGVNLEKFTALFTTCTDLSQNSIKDIIEKEHIDVLYVHKFPEITSILDQSAGRKIVRMFHDHDIYCPRKHKYFFHNREICDKAAGFRCYADLAFLEKKNGHITFVSIQKKLAEMRRNRALDQILAGSNFMKEQLVRNGFSAEKITILAPSVAPFPEPLRVIPEGVPHILFVGQLIRGKGVDLLIEALKRVRKTGTDFTCTILGRGNDSDWLETLVKEAGLEEKVTFIGWAAHEELASYYDQATVVAVPSRWPEPFGMVGLEAMARKRPVAAFRVGGIPDWLEDGITGILADPGDCQQFAEALIKLMTDAPLASAYGEAGYKRVQESFNFETYIGGLEKVLKENTV